MHVEQYLSQPKDSKNYLENINYTCTQILSKVSKKIHFWLTNIIEITYEPVQLNLKNIQMRQMGLCPPVEIMPVTSSVVEEVNEEDEEANDEVHENDIEVRELFGDRQSFIPTPKRSQRVHLQFHLNHGAL